MASDGLAIAVQKFCLAASKIYHSSVFLHNGLGSVVIIMVKEGRKMQVTTCLTYSALSGTLGGLQERMEDIMRLDQAISHVLLITIMEVLDQEWAVTPGHQKWGLTFDGSPIFGWLYVSIDRRGSIINRDWWYIQALVSSHSICETSYSDNLTWVLQKQDRCTGDQRTPFCYSNLGCILPMIISELINRFSCIGLQNSAK
jgi:hypothetical protein